MKVFVLCSLLALFVGCGGSGSEDQLAVKHADADEAAVPTATDIAALQEAAMNEAKGKATAQAAAGGSGGSASSNFGSGFAGTPSPGGKMGTGSFGSGFNGRAALGSGLGSSSFGGSGRASSISITTESNDEDNGKGNDESDDTTAALSTGVFIDGNFCPLTEAELAAILVGPAPTACPR